MTTVIRNQGTSLAVREKLAADGRPVLLAFSCDKDSFLAEYGLRKLGDKYLDGMAVARKLGGEL